MPIYSQFLSSVFLSVSHFSYDCSAYSKTVWNGQLYNVNPVETWPESTKRKMEGVEVPERDKFQANAYMTGGIIRKYGGSQPEVVVFGDSHALMWSGVIDSICKELNVTVSFYGADGTSPFVKLPLKASEGELFFTAEEKYVFDSKRLDSIREWRPKIVILVAKWSNIRDIKVTEDLVRAIGATGSRILLIEQPPELFFGDRNALQYLAFLSVSPKDNQRQYVRTTNMSAYEAGRDLIQKISAKYPYCTIVPVVDVFYKANVGAWVLDGDQVLYVDDDHLSQNGSVKVKR